MKTWSEIKVGEMMYRSARTNGDIYKTGTNKVTLYRCGELCVEKEIDEKKQALFANDYNKYREITTVEDTDLWYPTKMHYAKFKKYQEQNVGIHGEQYDTETKTIVTFVLA